MAISQAQFDALQPKLTDIGAAMSDLVMFYAKTKKALEDADFPLDLDNISAGLINKYMQKRALLVMAVNALPEIT